MVYTARPRGGWSLTAVHVVYVPVVLALLAGTVVGLVVLARTELRRARVAGSAA